MAVALISTACSSIRAGALAGGVGTSCRLWPALTDECAIVDHLMDESAYVDRRRLGGQPLCGTGADGMPNWLEAKMRLLRPVIQSDADSLLLIRLCMEEALSPDARKRPLAVGEITRSGAAAARIRRIGA